MRCVLWYHSCNFKNVKKRLGLLLLVMLQTKGNTPPQMFFTISKLYKLLQLPISLDIKAQFETIIEESKVLYPDNK